MSTNAKCGCVAKNWYGCIQSGKEDCDETTTFTKEDGTVVTYTHCCDYEWDAYIDDSLCKFRADPVAERSERRG